jgi:hypothetical protein
VAQYSTFFRLGVVYYPTAASDAASDKALRAEAEELAKTTHLGNMERKLELLYVT